MDLESVTDELYALPPERFIGERGARMKLAREAGDRALAARIGQLRRPTVGAWLVNLLVRQKPTSLQGVMALGQALRTAQASLAGDDLRRLSVDRHRLVSALVREASDLAAAAGHDVSGTAEDELAATLEAALADPEAAAAVRSGRLTTALRHSGFGLDGSPELEPPARRAGASRPAPADTKPGKTPGAKTTAPKPAPAVEAAQAASLAAEQAAARALGAAERATAELVAAQERQDAARGRVSDLEGQLERARGAITAAGADVRAAAKTARTMQRRADQARRAVDRPT